MACSSPSRLQRTQPTFSALISSLPQAPLFPLLPSVRRWQEPEVDSLTSPELAPLALLQNGTGPLAHMAFQGGTVALGQGALGAELQVTPSCLCGVLGSGSLSALGREVTQGLPP